MTKGTNLKHLSSASTLDCSLFFFNQFSDCDVKKSIVSITINAVGSDCLNRNMILPILNMSTIIRSPIELFLSPGRSLTMLMPII